jgi:integrase/recombinase XerD
MIHAETTRRTKRTAQPLLSPAAEQALTVYARYLREEQDVSPATLRNYVSDLRQFLAWCETAAAEQPEAPAVFELAQVTTPTLTRYRTHLQTEARLRPATVNRALISLKGYFAWAVDTEQLARDPARPVKLVTQEVGPPFHLTDRQEEALVAVVTAGGSRRDRTLLILMLHTGLRARETCQLQGEHVRLGQRSGTVQVWGKRNKYREVPLNATARAALEEYLPTLADRHGFLFPSGKTGQALTERALGQLVQKYATRAKLDGLSPHDLRHRFGYRMAERVPLHRLAQIMGHDSLDTTRIYTQGTPGDLQREVEKIAWE